MRLSIKRMGQRGVTLVELVIVLALCAILATTIIMLTTSMRGLVTNNEQLYNEMENLTYCRQFIEKWFHNFDETDNIYEIRENDLYITSDGVEYSIRVEEDKVLVDYPDELIDPELTDNPITDYYEFMGIYGIKFENYEDTRLYKCTIFYNDKDGLSFSFILGRRS